MKKWRECCPQRSLLFCLVWSGFLCLMIFSGFGCRQQTPIESLDDYSSPLPEIEKSSTVSQAVDGSLGAASNSSQTLPNVEPNGKSTISDFIRLAESQGIKISENADHSIKAIDCSALDYFDGFASEDWDYLTTVRVLKGKGRLSAEVIHSLEKMPQLTELLWTDVQLDEGQYLWSLLNFSPKLKKVRLTGLTAENALPILNVLSECPELTDLDISSSKITDNELTQINFQTGMKKLTHLNLYQLPVSNICVSILLPLKDRLIWLNLDATKIDEMVIPELTQYQKLKFLHLGRTNISSVCLDSLAEMKSLETLHISRTKIDENGADILREKLPSCNIISQVEE